MCKNAHVSHVPRLLSAKSRTILPAHPPPLSSPPQQSANSHFALYAGGLLDATPPTPLPH
jgi:hypothetical protein